MGYEFTMYPCNNQACIIRKCFKLLLSPALAKWAWLQLIRVPWPPELCILAFDGSSLHTRSTPPTPSSPWHGPPWGAFCSEGADAAFVTPISACHTITQRMAITWKAWAFLMLSFCPFILWLPKRKRVPKTRAEKIETKVRWIFSGPSQLYSTLLILRRTGLSHISPARCLGFWFWLKLTTT